MSGIVAVLNQPSVKQGIKYAFGGVTFAIGAQAAYDAIKGKFYSKYAREDSSFTARVDQASYLLAQASMVLSAAVSPIGITLISLAVNRVFTSAQLEKVFGPNTAFASNWKHPRHVVSLAAAGFSLPILVKRFFIKPVNPKKETKIQKDVLYTLLVSRPALHLANLLAQRIFSTRN